MSHTDRPPQTRRNNPSRSSGSPRRGGDRHARLPFDLSVDPVRERSGPQSPAEARRALDEALADLDRVFREPRERRESGGRDASTGGHATGGGDARAEGRGRRSAGDRPSDGERPGGRGAAAGPASSPAAAGAAPADAAPALPVRASARLGDRRPGWRRVAYPLVAAASLVGALALIRAAGSEPGRADAVEGARTASLTPGWALRGGALPGPARAAPANPAGARLAALPGVATTELTPYWLSRTGGDPTDVSLPPAPALRLRPTAPAPAALGADLSGVESVAAAAVARPLEGAAALDGFDPRPATPEVEAAGAAPREPYDALPRPRSLKAFRHRVAALASRAFRLEEDRVIELEATIGPGGGVEHVQTVKSTGVRDLDFAIMALVRELEFVPALRDGEPVEAVITWPITLQGKGRDGDDADAR